MALPKIRVSFTGNPARMSLSASGRPHAEAPLSSNRIALSSNESYPQYVVTAVIVAHDGVTWLPSVADALLDQTRAVQRVVAVDTGSRDRSGAVLASKFGQTTVFGMDRATGYGAAVARALHHRAANVPVPGGPGVSAADRVEWLWLLHDDCEPAPDALEQLLRGAAETNAAAVLGPKLRDWSNREVIIEAGVSLDTAARRLTGVEPREVDQGQHDGDRDTLAVSSAGMLVRRDVWEQVGGFDAAMSLFMEDVDFCWRVHAAGYRVRVITDAVCFHAQAATKHRLPVSVGRRARMLDRRNGLLTLLSNLPLRQMTTAAVGNVVVSLLRIAFFMLAKRLTAALDEAAAVSSVLCHPLRLITMRRRRSRGRRAAYNRVKADLPPGRSVRRLVEFAASTMAKSGLDTAGSHHASADPTEDDSMLVDNGLGRRLLTSPSLMTFIALTVVAIFAGRSLIGSGPLGGGSLVPAWGGASDLWHTYLQAFHPTGVGSSTSAPPYLAVLAILATVLAGKSWLAVDVLLIGCVPLAGMSAMLAARRVTANPAVRVWASVTYALLPIATGIVAAGRFGSALVFVLLPLIALHAGRILLQPGQRANRAAWAAGLLVAIGAAFVPMLWLIALVGCVVAAVVVRTTIPGLLRNLAIVALAAPILLLPWTLAVASQPAGLLLEAGLPQSGPAGLSGKMLLLLDPGGPGLPPYWITAGLLVAALAALFAGRRRKLITAGWGVALAGLLLAILVSHLVVSPQDGAPVTVWAGLPLGIAALGLLLAACIGGDALGRVRDGGKGRAAFTSGRGAWVGLISLIACSAPLLAAVTWISTGVDGPVHPVTSQVVPELVAVSDGQSRQVRTLVLREVDGHISYLLLRGPSPSLGDPELSSPPAAQLALAKAVATLISPDGGLAADQSQLLADFDIGYVLVQPPVTQQLGSLLDDVGGLRPYSTTSSYSIWQLVRPPARVTVLEPNGTVVPVGSGSTGVSGASVPVAGGTLMLAEPAGGWQASVGGHALTPVPSPAGTWAQAFKLPPGGGKLDLGHTGLVHDLWLIIEGLLFIAAIGLALPGIGVAEDAERADVAATARSREVPVPEPRVPQQRPATATATATATVGATARSSAPWAAAVEPEPDDAGFGGSGVGGTGIGGAGSGRAGIGGAAPAEREAAAPPPGRRVAAAGAAGVAAARVARSVGRGAGRGAGKDSAGKDSAGKDSAGKDSAGKDSAGKDSAGRGGLGKGGPVRGRGKLGRGRPADDEPDTFQDRSERSGWGDRSDRTSVDQDQVERAGYAERSATARFGRDDDPDRTRNRYDDDGAGLDRAGPGRAGLDRAGPGRAGPGRAEQRRAGLGRGDLSRTDQGRTDQGRGDLSRTDLGRADSGRAGLSRADVGRAELDRAGSADQGRLAEAWPQTSDREERRAARAAGPGARAWPYQDDADPPPSTDRRDDRGRDLPDLPVPSGRPPSRSPSGALPPVQWSARESGEHALEPYQRGRYEQDAGDPDRYQRDRSYEPPAPERSYSSERSYRDEPSYRDERSYPGDSYRDRPDHRRGDDAYSGQSADSRPGQRPADPPPSRWGRPGTSDQSTTSSRPMRSPSGQPDRGSQYDRTSLDRSSLDRSSTDRSSQLEPLPGWPGGGGDALEPLPPASGSADGGGGRTGAWRPDYRDSGDGWNEQSSADRGWSYPDGSSGSHRALPPGDDQSDGSHPYGSADWADEDRDGRERWPEHQTGYEGDTR